MRDAKFDIAKAIGIFAVVWGHTTTLCPIQSEIYLFHMPLFFVLSGYFFKVTKDTFKHVFIKKVEAYIIPYFVYMVICLVAFITLYYLTGHKEDIFIYPKMLIAPYGVCTTLWYLLALFEVYLLYFLLNRLSKKGWQMHIAVLACFSIAYVLYLNNIHIPLYVDSSLSMLLFFHFGYLLNKHSVLNTSAGKQVVYAVAGILFLATAIVLHLEVDIKNNILSSRPIVFILAAGGFSVTILTLSALFSKIVFLEKPLSYVGKETLAIFTLHILCFDLLRLTLNFPTVLQLPPYISGVILTLVAIPLSIVLGIPIQRRVIPKTTAMIQEIVNNKTK